jgi:hypothetical protein
MTESGLYTGVVLTSSVKGKEKIFQNKSQEPKEK